ncbi:MAG: radical SAM protein [Candidatus Gracilibacteria bacterium]|nr:radical SAM protein [Candidatus Gracilibacteria bacterium]
MSGKVRFDKNSGYKGIVEFEKIKNDIIYYKNLGYNSIGFLGGDISIHPNIYEILEESKKAGFEEINIITNAMIFSDYEKVKKLVLSGATRVNISIHSHKEEIEDYLTQIKGGLKKKLKAIDNFNKLYKKGILKSKISINIVLNKKNLSSITKTCLYFYTIKNIKDIRINFVRPDLGMKENFKNFVISYTEILFEIKNLIYISLKYNIRITFDTIPICIFYKIIKNKYIIDKFIGEKFDKIDEISDLSSGRKFEWKNKKTNELKYKNENCNKCIYNISCQGIRKEYYNIYGDGEILPIIN